MTLRRRPALLAVMLVALVALAACDTSTPPQPSTPTPEATVGVPTATSLPPEATATQAPQDTATAQPEPTSTAVTVEEESPTAMATDTPEEEASPTPKPRPTRTPTPETEATSTATGAQIQPGPTQPAGNEITYYFPVQPPSVTSYGSSHHDYPATDIFCPIGSKFVAPTSGVVEFVSRVDEWDPKTDDPAVRGGLSVSIIGYDGVRYYGSHLSAVAGGIEPGVPVKGGQLLGLTGKSGNARYTDPHLHFGISHPTTPDDWKTRRGEINPYKYLRAWQKGQALKPTLP